MKNYPEYELDMDDNNMLKLTEKNVRFIETAIKIDSSYRNASNKNNTDSAWNYVLSNKNNIQGNKEVIKEICRRIDKENSTHLSVSGTKKGEKNNTGIDDTADYIASIQNLKGRLEKGDTNLVKEIAIRSSNYTDVNNGIKNNFSFASKFCAYMCSFLFEGEKEQDNYVIYDGVLANVLPYYEWRYLGNKEYTSNNGKSLIDSKIRKQLKYEKYKELIDNIRENGEKEYTLSRREFDHILWYYYKGAKEEIDSALKMISKN